jgi:hypothetical protein
MIEEIIREIPGIVEDGGMFESNGYSKISVMTRKGKVTYLIPITDRNINKIDDEIKRLAPVPPVITRKLTPEEGERLGVDINSNTMVKEFNTSDPDYRSKLRGFGEEVIWRRAVQGMTITYNGSDGKNLSFEEKKEILVSHGFTVFHANKIYSDIRKMSME